MKDTLIRVDLAKRVLQVHSKMKHEDVILRKKLSRHSTGTKLVIIGFRLIWGGRYAGSRISSSCIQK